MNAAPELTREDLALLEALDEATPEQRFRLHRELEADSTFAREFHGVEETVLEVDSAFCAARSIPIAREPQPLSPRALARVEGAQKELLGGLPARMKTNTLTPPPPPVVRPAPLPAATPARRPMPRHGGSWAVWAAGLVILCAVWVIFANRPRPPVERDPIVESAGKDAATEIPSRGLAEPPKSVTATAIDYDPVKPENRQVKGEVLARIDQMPITQAQKDQLYVQVERTRQMGKVLTIPFARSFTTLGATNREALKKELSTPALMALRDDPTAIFVVLGFADPKGDAAQNRRISQQRADAVLKAMRDECGVANVLHSLGMGASTLLDEQQLEKNRISEVWAVLPP